MAKNVLRRNLDRAREKFEEVEDSTGRYIKKNPFKSALIALGIGAVIGAGIALGTEAIVRSKMRRQSFWERHNPFG